MSRRLKWWLGVPLLLLALLAGAAAWLLFDPRGLAFTLARIDPFVPGRVVAETASGPLVGPWHVEGLRWQDGERSVTIGRLDLAWVPSALFEGRLHVRELALEGVRVDLPAGGEEPTAAAPEGAPAWPELPLAVRVDALRVADATFAVGGPEPYRVSSLDVAARLDRRGLAVEKLAFAGLGAELELSGRIAAAAAGQSELSGRWRWERPGLPPLAGRFELAGDTGELHGEHVLVEPQPLRLVATVEEPFGARRWSATLTGERLDPGAIDPALPGWPLGVTLELTGQALHYAGTLALEAEHPELGPLTVDGRFEGTPSRIAFERLALRSAADDGPQLTFDALVADLAAEPAEVEASGAWQRLRWPLAGPPTASSPAGRFALRGPVDDYRVEADVELVLPDAPELALAARGRGDLARAELASWTLTAPRVAGRVAGTGRVAWGDGLDWALDGSVSELDPSGWNADWPGELAGSFRLHGSDASGEPLLAAEIDALSGTLRGRPFRAGGRLRFDGGTWRIAAAELRSGDARLTADGQVGERFDLAWRADVPDLADLLPDAAGSIDAEGSLNGPLAQPRLVARGTLAGLRYRDQALEQVELDARLGLRPDDPFELSLRARGLQSGARPPIERVRLDATGTAGDHRLELALASAQGDVDARVTGGLRDGAWHGTLASATLAETPGGSWRLAGTPALDLAADRVDVARHCWQRTGPGEASARLCAAADWRAGGAWHVDARAERVPVSLFAAWLPEAAVVDAETGGTLALTGAGGAVSEGRATLELGPGTLEPGAWAAEKVPIELRGGAVRLELGGRGLTGDVTLELADGGRLDGQVALPGYRAGGAPAADQRLDAEVEVALERLERFAPLLPDVTLDGGTLNGRLVADGTLARPGLRGDARLALSGLALPRRGVAVAETSLALETADAGTLHVTGHLEDPAGRADLDGRVTLDEARGWPLELTVEGALADGTPFGARASGRRAAESGWEASVDFDEMPLAPLLRPFPQVPVVGGSIDGDVRLAGLAGDRPTGSGTLRISSGTVDPGVWLPGAAPVSHQGGEIELRLDADGLQARGALAFAEEGRLALQVRLPELRTREAPLAEQPLDGRITADLSSLTVLGSLLPVLAISSGDLHGELDLAGTPASPRVHGRLELATEQVEIAHYGIQLRELTLTAESDGGELLQVHGSARSGDGRAEVDGRLTLDPAQGWPLELAVTGEDFEAVDQRELWLTVSPDLELTVREGEAKLTGTLVVPAAEIRPNVGGESLKRASPDTVVVHEQTPEEGPAEPAGAGLRVTARLRLELGEKVRFQGFGLQGRITGALDITDPPDGAPRGNGELRVVDGTFSRYGQDLSIRSGRLLFAGGSLDNPGIEARAERTVDDVTAGVRLRGTLRNPEASLYSDPSLPQADILSYLVSGRPAGAAGGSSGGTALAPAAALGYVSDSPLVRDLQRSFGIENLSLESDASGDRMSLTLGRYLSPDIYVGYAIGLTEPTNQFKIRYDVTKRLSIEAESGTHSGADIRYTIER